MRAITFFILLCLLLLKVDAPVHPGAQANNILCPVVQHVKKTTQQEKEYSIVIDAENEDEDEGSNNKFGKKYRLLTKHYLLLFSPALLSNPYSYSKIPTPFGSRSSYLYITQRVLRI